MTRRSNAGSRCLTCRMHKSICLCADVPRIETRTRLLLLIHRLEARKPTNTGQLAAQCLVNSEVVARGYASGGDTDGVLAWDPNTQPLMLFPHADATPLASWASRDKPVTLIVPDGTWRQAFKMKKRVPELAGVPCVTLPEGDATLYRLRIERHPGGLATIEAIARAMRILEGADVEEALNRIFRMMVERTLWVRGSLTTAEVTDGIPHGAQKHAPLG